MGMRKLASRDWLSSRFEVFVEGIAVEIFNDKTMKTRFPFNVCVHHYILKFDFIIFIL